MDNFICKGWLKQTLLVAALGSAFCARAGTLYTINISNNELQTFDTRTLAFTNVATVNAAFSFGDLADNGTNMYMSQGFSGTGLYTLNLTNGNATLVGDTGLGNLFSLAFDQTGTLYGGLSTTGSGFYSLNTSNGTPTYIGNPGISLDAMTYLPGQDLLLGIYAGPSGLYSINRSTGASTLIGGSDFINNCGMAYDPDTGLVWVVDYSGQVITFDPNNNFAESIVLTGQGAHDGLAAIPRSTPEPATMAGLAAGMFVLLRRRRK